MSVIVSILCLIEGGIIGLMLVEAKIPFLSFKYWFFLILNVTLLNILLRTIRGLLL